MCVIVPNIKNIKAIPQIARTCEEWERVTALWTLFLIEKHKYYCWRRESFFGFITILCSEMWQIRATYLHSREMSAQVENTGVKHAVERLLELGKWFSMLSMRSNRRTHLISTLNLYKFENYNKHQCRVFCVCMML